MGEDWDLDAVVRGCRAAAAGDPFSGFAALECDDVELAPLETTMAGGGGGGGDGLFELCRPFIQRGHQPVVAAIQRGHQPVVAAQQRNVHSGVAAAVSGGQRRRLAACPNSRAKKRKNQQKKVVCEVPVDGVSADLWAWRKYGQKPIKGSPYPRGYYRCSSLKGCPARKQVERNPNNPGLLMITYTAEHNHPVPTHRNSLAGSTRGQKPPTTTHGGLSPTTPLEDDLLHSPNRPCKSEEEGESEELLVEDMELMGEDDFLFLGGELANVATSSTWISGAAVPGNR